MLAVFGFFAVFIVAFFTVGTFGLTACGFGLFGREEDLFIKWCDIEVIGEDTILVSCETPSYSTNKRGKLLGNLFK